MGTMGTAAAAADDERDWSVLPEGLLLSAMGSMEVPDIVRSGAVCSSWRAAYDTFRRLRLPTPKQAPCLLYACDAVGADAVALYSPSSDTTFRLAFPDPPPPLHGLAHGWLFTTDQAANPYLLNPLTGARAALPPVSTLERVKSSFLDGDGDVVYNVDRGWTNGPNVRQFTSQSVRDSMYLQVAVSASGAASSCVVLLLHGPHAELSFARPGDERWTSLYNHLAPLFPGFILSVVYNEKDGLFYVLRDTAVHALDLRGASPVARHVSFTASSYNGLDAHYLVPAEGGDLLLVNRRACFPGEDDNGAATSKVSVYKIDVLLQRLVRLADMGDNALFLGHNSPMCLPIHDYPMLKRNCAYVADNNRMLYPLIRHRDVGISDFKTASMQACRCVAPPSCAGSNANSNLD